MNNKIPPPIVTLISGLAIYFSRNLFPNHYGLILDVCSILLLICGIIIIRTAFLSFKNHQTTINPLNLTKTSTLVNTGIFKYTRNPMYLGMVFILLSIALKLIPFEPAHKLCRPNLHKIKMRNKLCKKRECKYIRNLN